MRGNCEACNDAGLHVPASPSCRLGHEPGWIVVERCDACEMFADDHAAASTVFHEVQWIVCANHGDHVVGRLPFRSLSGIGPSASAVNSA